MIKLLPFLLLFSGIAQASPLSHFPKKSQVVMSIDLVKAKKTGYLKPLLAKARTEKDFKDVERRLKRVNLRFGQGIKKVHFASWRSKTSRELGAAIFEGDFTKKKMALLARKEGAKKRTMGNIVYWKKGQSLVSLMDNKYLVATETKEAMKEVYKKRASGADSISAMKRKGIALVYAKLPKEVTSQAKQIGLKPKRVTMRLQAKKVSFSIAMADATQAQTAVTMLALVKSQAKSQPELKKNGLLPVIESAKGSVDGTNANFTASISPRVIKKLLEYKP